MRVVLPAPLRPTRPTRSPGPTRKVASSMRMREPARSSRPVAVITRWVAFRGRRRGRGGAAGRARPSSASPSSGSQARSLRSVSFNDDASLDTSQVESGGGGGRLSGGMLPIGGGVGGIVLFIVIYLIGQATGGTERRRCPGSTPDGAGRRAGGSVGRQPVQDRRRRQPRRQLPGGRHRQQRPGLLGHGPAGGRQALHPGRPRRSTAARPSRPAARRPTTSARSTARWTRRSTSTCRSSTS